MVIVVTYDNVRKDSRYKLPEEVGLMDLTLPYGILLEAEFVALASWTGLTTIKGRNPLGVHNAIDQLVERKSRLVMDFEGGLIEQQIVELEKELDQAERKVTYLRSEIERKRLELRLHREKIRKSGIKY